MIVNINNFRKVSRNIHGNKAYNLSILMRNGINIPDGYLISSKLLDSLLNDSLSDFTSIKELIANHDVIIKDILDLSFPSKIRNQLSNIFDNLTNNNNTSIIVRSSSLIEDSENHSMAGMFESIFDINSFEDMLSGIKKCYASLFSEKVLVYLFKNELDVSLLKMGIIIQKYIIADKSGVLFTADTKDMKDNIIINSVSGACDNLVSSKQKSNIVKLDRKTGKVIGELINENTILSENEVNDIYLKSFEIEKYCGKHIDIEWLIINKKLFILQSRPVTGYYPEVHKVKWKAPSSKKCYIRSDFYELPLKPVSYFHAETLEKNLAIAINKIGFETKTKKIINGYIYETEGSKYNDDNVEALKKKVWMDRKKKFLKGKIFFVDEYLPEIKKKIRNINNLLKKDNLKYSNVKKLFIRANDYYNYVMQRHAPSATGRDILSEYKELFLKEFPDLNDNDFYDLVYKQSILSKEKMEILKIAEFVKYNNLLSYFKSNKYSSILYYKLPKITNGLILLKMIEKYLNKFGLLPITNRAYQTLSPVLFFEKPYKIIDRIKAVLNIDLSSILANKKNIMNNKYRVKKKLLSSYSKVFTPSVILGLEKFALAQEDHTFYIDMAKDKYFRLTCIKAGKLFKDSDILERKDDINFLDYSEIISLLDGKKIKNIKKVITERKGTFKIQQNLPAPESIGKKPKETPKENIGIDDDKLKGVANMQKKVKGVAKLCRMNFDEMDIKEGTILVFMYGHSYDIFPVIDKVKGVIYDYDSPYDHVALLVREFGIPAIYNTKNATKLIKDGDIVEIDGLNNEVRILK